MVSRRPEIQEMLAALQTNQLTRRQVLKRAAALGLAVPSVSALLAACETDDDAVDDVDDEAPAAPDDDDDVDDVEPDDDDDDVEVDDTDDDAEVADDDEPDDDVDDEEGQVGGTLEVALIGEPPTLDIHQTTATIVALNAWHIYEPLFTWDEDFQVTPELAESHEVSDDGMTNSITLRDGITFHNGDDLTADDVVASIERWGGISGLGGSLLENVDDIEVVDDLTIEFHMTEPYGAFAVALGRQNQGCAIYPESVIDASDDTDLDEYIGTGPYRFVEWVSDQHIHLERYDDYVSRDEPTSGYAGMKNQYVDEFFLRPVPDEASRIAGIQAGDYDYLESVVPDNFETLDNDENVVAEVMGTSGWAVFVLNTEEGPCTDWNIRKAIQAAVDCEPLMQAGYGEGFYELDPGIMHQETVWNSQVGAELYDLADPDLAAEYLEDADYDGTPIRLMTTQEYAHQYNQAAVLEQQLTDAGFEVELEVFDWATLTERRNNPGDWDIFTTSFSFRVDPIQLPMLQGTSWPGWWSGEEKEELTDRLERETEFEDRFEVLEQIQELFYEDAPQVKVGDSLEVSARSPRVQNFTTPTQLQPSFWNIWLED